MPFFTQGKTNWKYILIVLILAVIVGGGILWWIRTTKISFIEFPEVKKLRKIVKDEATNLEARTELSKKALGLKSWEIEELKKKGLKDPIKDLKTDLMKHPELIPYPGVLGGTMGFYFEDKIWILTKKWVLAWFDDGHIGGYILLEYKVSDDGEVSWKVIDSYLD